MGGFLSYLVSLSLIFAPFQVFSPITLSSVGRSLRVRQNALSQLVHEAPGEYIRETVSDNNEYNVDNYTTVTLGGYCSINVPMSHITIEQSSTDTLKNLTYRNNRSRFIMSYASEVDKSVDMAGYVCNELLSLNTTTNSNEVKTYGDTEWHYIKADTNEGVNAVYVWYTLDNTKTSVFYVKASVHPEDDNEEFSYVVDKMLATYKLLRANGSVFETPDSGIYADANSDQENYKAANEYNTIFGTRGGYIEGADISSDWHDLEIILDGHKLKLPCKMQDLYDANFELNDKIVTAENMSIWPDNILDVEMINDKGTVITAVAYNDSNQEKKLADDVQVIKLKVDADKMVSFVDKETEDDEGPDEIEEEQEIEEITEESTEEATETPTEVDETPDYYTDEELMDIAQEARNIMDSRPNIGNIKQSRHTDGKQSVDEYLAELKEEYEEEQTMIASGQVSENFVSKFSEDEAKMFEKEGLSTKKSSDRAAETNLKAHEMILAGGVTWDVYADDLIKFYGENCSKASFSEYYECKWETSEVYMIIRVDKISGIKYIELSSMVRF